MHEAGRTDERDPTPKSPIPACLVFRLWFIRNTVWTVEWSGGGLEDEAGGQAGRNQATK